MAKKYASLNTLQLFLNSLKEIFSTLGHKHTVSDIADYQVDTALSADSSNPVANKVLNEEFDAIGEAFAAYDLLIDAKTPIIEVTELPTSDIAKNTFYRYTELQELFYAITSTSKNIVKKEYLNTEFTMHVDIIPVDVLPDYSSAIGATNAIDNVTLYYQRADGKVYGAINSITLMLTAQVGSMGWYEPTCVIENYAGVIHNVLDAEYGYVYVVHEIKDVAHTVYYHNGSWYEVPTDINNI